MTATFERHPLQVGPLVAGCAFLVIGAVALARQLHWIHLSGRAWAGVVVLAVGISGAAGILASAVRSSRRRDDPS
jgi:hypothetical protein